MGSYFNEVFGCYVGYNGIADSNGYNSNGQNSGELSGLFNSTSYNAAELNGVVDTSYNGIDHAGELNYTSYNSSELNAMIARNSSQFFPPAPGGTSHYLDQRDGAWQSDSSMHNPDVPITNGTLTNPHITDGTQLLQISRENAAAQLVLEELPFDAVDFANYLRPIFEGLDEGGTQNPQADRSMQYSNVPTSGTLPDPHETEMQLDENAAARLTSWVWHEFQIIERNQSNRGPVRAKCKHCQRVLRCPTSNGTGALSNHLLKSNACPYRRSSTAEATTNPATGNWSRR